MTDQQPGLPTECPICGNYQWKQIGLPDHTFRVTFGCGTRWFGLGNGVMESMQKACKRPEQTSDDRERMERLRSTIRSRKALYEGLAAVNELDCPECPGTTTEHYPDCGVGADERHQERTGQ